MKKLLLFATDRYSINIDDFYMFYRRTGHQIIGILHHSNVPKKKWWAKGKFPDPARDKLLDPLNKTTLPLIPWTDPEQLPALLDAQDFDYVAMGNGCGADHQVVIDHVGVERCLFTEYGWLPWSANFYISRDGCGVRSEIARLTREDLADQPVRASEIEAFRKSLDHGRPVPHEDFIYVPLQKDVNDFKFTFCNFRNNPEFLDFIHELVPAGMKILVKEHPLYRMHYNYRKYGRNRFVDISHGKLNKFSLFQRMAGMICINSTSILEALSFHGKVFAYGEDLFLNKGVVHFRVTEPKEFEAKLQELQDGDACDRFVSLLFERQITRRRCLENDRDYIESHYWNRAI